MDFDINDIDYSDLEIEPENEEEKEAREEFEGRYYLWLDSYYI